MQHLLAQTRNMHLLDELFKTNQSLRSSINKMIMEINSYDGLFRDSFTFTFNDDDEFHNHTKAIELLGWRWSYEIIIDGDIPKYIIKINTNSI